MKLKDKEGSAFELWEVLRAKGKPSPMYQTTTDQVTVTLTEGAVKYTRADGGWTIEQERFGDVRFAPKGTVLQEEGLNDVPGRVVVFRIISDAPRKLAPVMDGIPDQFPRLDATKLFETDRLIVWDQVWLPNRPVTNHLHYNQTAYVFLGGGSKLRLRELGKSANPTQAERRMLGDTAIITPIQVPHEEEWVEGEPRAIWVELK